MEQLWVEHRLLEPFEKYKSDDFWTSSDHSDYLGCGGYGGVRICQHNQLGAVVVKCIALTGESEAIERKFKSVRREAAVLGMVRHQHIVEVLGFTSWHDCNNVGIVLELVECGNLDSLLRSERVRRIPWPLRKRIALQLAKALDHLHRGCAKSFCHGDVKPENVLLDRDLNVKLADFGAANIVKASQARTSTTERQLGVSRQITMLYAAPESFEHNSAVNHKMDVYSVGMVLYELITRQVVYAGHQVRDDILITNISMGTRPEKTKVTEVRQTLADENDLQILDQLATLMSECWDKEASLRPSTDEIVSRLSSGFVEEPSLENEIAEISTQLKKTKSKNAASQLSCFCQPFKAVETVGRSNTQTALLRLASRPEVITSQEPISTAQLNLELSSPAGESETVPKSHGQGELAVDRLRDVPHEEVSVSQMPILPNTGEESTNPVKFFQQQFDVNQDVSKVLQESKELIQQLRANLEEFAVTTITYRPVLRVNYQPNHELLPTELKFDQDKFQAKCVNVTKTFLGEFVSESRTFNKPNLQALRLEKGWNNFEHGYVEIEATEKEKLLVYIRFRKATPKVTVSGLRVQVSDAMEYLRKKCEISVKSVLLDSYVYRALCDCNMLAELSKNHRWIKERKCIEFSGLHDEVCASVQNLDSVLKSLCTAALPNRDKKHNFLVDALNRQDGAQVRQEIQSRLWEQDTYVSLYLQADKVCLKYVNTDQLTNGTCAIMDLIKQDKIHFEKGFQDHLGTQQWKAFVENMHRPGRARLFENAPDGYIEVVGLASNFESKVDRIKKHIKENTPVQQEIAEKCLVVEYYQKFPDAKKSLKGVEVSFGGSKKNPTFVLKGKPNDIQAAENTIKTATVLQRKVLKPGMNKYLRSANGRAVVNEIAKQHHCIGFIDPPEWKYSAPSNNKKTGMSFRLLKLVWSFLCWLLHWVWRGIITCGRLAGKKLLQLLQARADHFTAVSTDLPGNPSIELVQGDITVSDCEAIVNSTSSYYDMKGQVGAKILSQGGACTSADHQQNLIHQSNNVRVTSAGNLRARFVYHVVTPKKHSMLQPILLELFQEAENHGLSSIALPAVGTGKLGLPEKVVAAEIHKAIENFKETKPKYLVKIQICIFRVDVMKEFSKKFSLPKVAVLKPKDYSSPSIPKKHAAIDAVDVLICSRNQRSVNEAWRALTQRIEQLSSSESISGEIFEKLTDIEKEELLEMAKSSNVIIEQPHENQITLSGLYVDVRSCLAKAQKLVNEFSQALICSTYVKWKYEIHPQLLFADYPISVNHRLEREFQANKSGSAQTNVRIYKVTVQHNVDFQSMTFVRAGSNRTLRIKRTRVSCIPKSWSPMDESPWKRVPLSSTSKEYQDVQTQFYASVSDHLISKVERVQNPTLFDQFFTQSQYVADRLKNAGSNLPATMDLFHGTSADCCDNICANNFDRGYSGINGSAYGKGVYFASTAKYALSFSPADYFGKKRLFIAKVVTGKFCRGDSSLRRAPMQSDCSPYDSAVNDENNPTIYVVFRDQSVYPAYIVTYT